MRSVPWRWRFASVASGVLYFVGFAGFDVWPFAFIAFVPHLFAITRGAGSAKQAAGLGFLFGLVTNLGGYYWIIGMLEDFSGFPYALCVLFGVLICAYQAGQLALFSWVWTALRPLRWPSAVTVPLVLTAVEWVYPFLFHSYFGNSLHGVPALIQIADLGGPLLVTALLAAVNGALFDALDPTTTRARKLRELAVALACVGLSLGYGAYRIREIDARAAEAPALRVALVQANLGLFEKRGKPQEGLRKHQDLSLEAERTTNPDLILWPESSVTFLLAEGDRQLGALLGGLKTPLLFGGLLARRGETRREHFNSAFMLDAKGTVQGTYDKVYLLPFGEYLPFGEWFPKLYDISKNSGRFTPGRAQTGVPFGEQVIAPLICYEDIIPAFVRRAVRETRAGLLVNLTNDAWFGDTTEPWEHLALAKFRAVEHHRYLVRATNSGVSAIVDPVGRVLSVGPVFEPAIVHGTVRWMHETTVYQAVGDVAGWGPLLLLVGLGVWRRRQKSDGTRSA